MVTCGSDSQDHYNLVCEPSFVEEFLRLGESFGLSSLQVLFWSSQSRCTRITKIQLQHVRLTGLTQRNRQSQTVHDWVVCNLSSLLSGVGHRVKIHKITPCVVSWKTPQDTETEVLLIY